MRKVTINAPKWSDVINEKFLPLLKCEDRHLIMYGSRASSKSYFAAELILDRCLSWKNYTCVCIRQEVSKNADSTFKLLCKTIERNNLTGLFSITHSPNMRIRCENGNEILFRGMDNIENIKSLVNVSNIYFEEEVPTTEQDFETVALTMRGKSAKFLQIIYTINPTIPDHQNHWFWKRWFDGESEMSFRKTIRIDIGEEVIEESATVHHSTYLDNRWCDKGTYNALQMLKLKDPYVYSTQALGRWAAKTPKGRFWKLFDLAKNVVPRCEYDEDLPLHLSFDFNKNPGMHVGVYQIDGKQVRQVNELALKNPNNRTTDACEVIKKLYKNHTSGVYIYGDPNGYKEDSSTAKGYNNFAIIFDMLKTMRPQDRTIRKAPPVAKSGEWLNEIFFSKLDGIEVLIPETCSESLADFLYTQEAPDGTILKPKILDKEENIRYEKWGHFSDLFRYLMVSAFSSEFNKYKNPSSGPISMGNIARKNSW